MEKVETTILSWILGTYQHTLELLLVIYCLFNGSFPDGIITITYTYVYNMWMYWYKSLTFQAYKSGMNQKNVHTDEYTSDYCDF